MSEDNLKIRYKTNYTVSIIAVALNTQNKLVQVWFIDDLYLNINVIK